MKGSGRGYAGISLNLGLIDYLKNFFQLFLANDIYFYLVCGMLLVAFATGDNLIENIKKFVNQNLVALLLSLSVLLPQVILYTQTGWQIRYYLPSFVAISLFLVIILNYLKQYADSGVYKIFYLLILFYLILEMTPKISDNPEQAFRHARNHASFAENTELLLKSVVSQSTPNSLILIVSDPVENTVQPNSLASFLQNFFQRSNLKNLPLSMPYAHFANHEERYKEIKNNFSEIEDRNKIEHIIIMPHREELFLYETKDWFDNTKYNRYAFWKLVHYAKK